MRKRKMRTKLHNYVNRMDDYQLDLVVAFLEELFDLKEVRA